MSGFDQFLDFTRCQGTTIFRKLGKEVEDIRYYEIVAVVSGFTPLPPLEGSKLKAKTFYIVVVTDWVLYVLDRNGGNEGSILYEIPLLLVRQLDVQTADRSSNFSLDQDGDYKTSIISVFPAIDYEKVPAQHLAKLRQAKSKESGTSSSCWPCGGKKENHQANNPPNADFDHAGQIRTVSPGQNGTMQSYQPNFNDVLAAYPSSQSHTQAKAHLPTPAPFDAYQFPTQAALSTYLKSTHTNMAQPNHYYHTTGPGPVMESFGSEPLTSPFSQSMGPRTSDHVNTNNPTQNLNKSLGGKRQSSRRSLASSLRRPAGQTMAEVTAGLMSRTATAKALNTSLKPGQSQQSLNASLTSALQFLPPSQYQDERHKADDNRTRLSSGPMSGRGSERVPESVADPSNQSIADRMREVVAAAVAAHKADLSGTRRPPGSSMSSTLIRTKPPIDDKQGSKRGASQSMLLSGQMPAQSASTRPTTAATTATRPSTATSATSRKPSESSIVQKRPDGRGKFTETMVVRAVQESERESVERQERNKPGFFLPDYSIAQPTFGAAAPARVAVVAPQPVHVQQEVMEDVPDSDLIDMMDDYKLEFLAFERHSKLWFHLRAAWLGAHVKQALHGCRLPGTPLWYRPQAFDSGIDPRSRSVSAHKNPYYASTQAGNSTSSLPVPPAYGYMQPPTGLSGQAALPVPQYGIQASGPGYQPYSSSSSPTAMPPSPQPFNMTQPPQTPNASYRTQTSRPSTPQRSTPQPTYFFQSTPTTPIPHPQYPPQSSRPSTPTAQLPPPQQQPFSFSQYPTSISVQAPAAEVSSFTSSEQQRGGWALSTVRRPPAPSFEIPGSRPGSGSGSSPSRRPPPRSPPGVRRTQSSVPGFSPQTPKSTPPRAGSSTDFGFRPSTPVLPSPTFSQQSSPSNTIPRHADRRASVQPSPVPQSDRGSFGGNLSLSFGAQSVALGHSGGVPRAGTGHGGGAERRASREDGSILDWAAAMPPTRFTSRPGPIAESTDFGRPMGGYTSPEAVQFAPSTPTAPQPPPHYSTSPASTEWIDPDLLAEYSALQQSRRLRLERAQNMGPGFKHSPTLADLSVGGNADNKPVTAVQTHSTLVELSGRGASSVRAIFRELERRLSRPCSVFDRDDMDAVKELELELSCSSPGPLNELRRLIFSSRKVMAFTLSRLTAWGALTALATPRQPEGVTTLEEAATGRAVGSMMENEALTLAALKPWRPDIQMLPFRSLLSHLGLSMRHNFSIRTTMDTVVRLIKAQRRLAEEEVAWKYPRDPPPPMPDRPTLPWEPLMLSPVSTLPYLFIEVENAKIRAGWAREGGPEVTQGVPEGMVDVSDVLRSLFWEGKDEDFVEEERGPAVAKWERLMIAVCARLAWRKIKVVTAWLSRLLAFGEGCAARMTWLSDKLVEVMEDQAPSEGWTFKDSLAQLAATLVQLRDPTEPQGEYELEPLNNTDVFWWCTPGMELPALDTVAWCVCEILTLAEEGDEGTAFIWVRIKELPFDLLHYVGRRLWLRLSALMTGVVLLPVDSTYLTDVLALRVGSFLISILGFVPKIASMLRDEYFEEIYHLYGTDEMQTALALRSDSLALVPVVDAIYERVLEMILTAPSLVETHSFKRSELPPAVLGIQGSFSRMVGFRAFQNY